MELLWILTTRQPVQIKPQVMTGSQILIAPLLLVNVHESERGTVLPSESGYLSVPKQTTIVFNRSRRGRHFLLRKLANPVIMENGMVM